MALYLIIFIVLMLGTILLSFSGTNGSNVFEGRKKQSKNRLRENVLKQRLEKFTEEKVKFSKRYSIETLSLQAGYSLTYVEFMFLSLGCALIGAFVAGEIFNNPGLSILFFVIGYMLPKEALVALRNKRINTMERQIGPFMQMVIKRYETTKDFGKSLELTLTEFKGEEPMYSELKQTVLEINVGLPVSEAMDNMGRRTGNKYMARLSDYYKIASSLGTDEIRKRLLTQAYSQFEENRKGKATLKKELNGAKSEAYIMLASIPAFALYQVFTNDTYVDFMTNTMTGKIGTAGISAIFMGCLWFINTKIGAPLE